MSFTTPQHEYSIQCKQSAWIFAGLIVYGIPVAIATLLLVWLLGSRVRKLVHPKSRQPQTLPSHSSHEGHELVSVIREVDGQDPSPEYHRYVSDIPGHIEIDDRYVQIPPPYNPQETENIALPPTVAIPSGRTRTFHLQRNHPPVPRICRATLPHNRHVCHPSRNSETPWRTLLVGTCMLLLAFLLLAVTIFSINAASLCFEDGEQPVNHIAIICIWIFFAATCIMLLCAVSYWLILLKEAVWPEKQITYPFDLTGLYVIKWVVALVLAPVVVVAGLVVFSYVILVFFVRDALDWIFDDGERP